MFLVFGSSVCLHPARTPVVVASEAWPSRYIVRVADLAARADCLAICAIRQPSTLIAEEGSVGFMGARTVLEPDEAYRRRVKARLGTAIDDGATVLVALPPEQPADAGTVVVVATCDCVERDALPAQDLPSRLMVRNLMVIEEHRRRGVARQLMGEACELARSRGFTAIALEVCADNRRALRLYDSMGFRSAEGGEAWREPASTSKPLAWLKQRLSIDLLLLKDL